MCVTNIVSFRPSDSALLLPSNARVVHECIVEHVAKEWVILKITDGAKADWSHTYSHTHTHTHTHTVLVLVGGVP